MSNADKIRLTGDDLLKIEGQYPGHRVELIDGELRLLPPNGLQHAATASNIVFLLAQYQHDYQTGIGLAGATGFYTRHHPHTVRMSDAAFITHQSLLQADSDGYLWIAPELVVEIIGPEDDASEIEEKIQEWLDFGVRLLWVVYPKTRRVYVYQPDSQPVMLKAHDTLTGGAILPGFSAKVNEFFEA